MILENTLELDLRPLRPEHHLDKLKKHVFETKLQDSRRPGGSFSLVKKHQEFGAHTLVDKS